MASDAATTQLARIECNRRHWDLHVVSTQERYMRRGEWWITRSHDLLGFADGLVLDVEHSTMVLLQWTARANLAARRAKLLASESVKGCVLCGCDVLLWGFDLDDGALSEERFIYDVSPQAIRCVR